ncbi:hypothetical protein NQ318_012108 [Aromia moschata]|uniref:Endonuclease/exonuclease/phosphatase domain-containing protein n=1 Tax=Aromia moschata TaxID=1265417 RepID=A0AAV8YQQ4_9CUCU|nr:hypothetical protein NQ318_012108 [Aromia moschata]
MSYARAAINSPTLDFAPLVEQLIPKLMTAITPLIKQESFSKMVAPITAPEKRKRTNSPDQVSLSSGDETSLSSVVADRKKKKKKTGMAERQISYLNLSSKTYISTMASNVLQWNCNGCKTHYPELKSLMLEKSSFAICLQETHLKPDEIFNLRGYNSVRKDVIPRLRARGGVAIFIKNSIPYQEVPIQSDLQVIAIQIEFPYKMTLCNIYLPDFNWSIDDLLNISSQLPTPFIINGDFNAHNVLWGSGHTDARGRMIETLIEEIDVVLLNTGDGTYLNSRSNNFSAIDLTLCSPQMATRLSWSVMRDVLYSDHHPILIEITSELNPTTNNSKRWRLHQANWFSYAENIHLPPPNGDVNFLVNQISNTIIDTASECIPMSEGHRPRKHVPWWNAEIREAVKEKKRTLNTFKRCPTRENMILFKQSRARARRIIITSKRNSWREYVSSITSQTSNSDVWKKLKKICGNNLSETSPVLVENGQIIREPNEIPDVLGRHFQEISSDDNYDLTFMQSRRNLEIPLDFSENNTSVYNSPLTIEEMENALSSLPVSIIFKEIYKVPLMK